MTIIDWNIEQMTGYKPLTTLYTDFSIADRFGVGAIKDTYKRALEYGKMDYKALTELVMVLNWKSWEHQNNPLCNVYCDLYYACDKYAITHLKGAQLSYYYTTTD